MTKPMRPDLSFRTGAAGRNLVLCLACSMDDHEPTRPYSPIYFFVPQRPRPWLYNEHEFVITSVATWRDPAQAPRGIFVALGEDGRVVLLDSPHQHERILDAGAHEGSKRSGYLQDIQQIGGRLYACGASGQVYRRNGENDWVHVDEGLLQPPDSDAPTYLAQVVNGPHEDALYVAGFEAVPGSPPRADHWDGQRWQRLALPETAGRITNMHVESEDRILMCGARGTLLVGNARDGFVHLGPVGGNQLFTSMTIYRDRYYLASNLGLFVYDPRVPTNAFEPVRTNLEPDLQDANVVDAVEDVLWSIGPKDVARFDGVTWERFDHPNNPKIGAPPPRPAARRKRRGRQGE